MFRQDVGPDAERDELLNLESDHVHFHGIEAVNEEDDEGGLFSKTEGRLFQQSIANSPEES